MGSCPDGRNCATSGGKDSWFRPLLGLGSVVVVEAIALEKILWLETTLLAPQAAPTPQHSTDDPSAESHLMKEQKTNMLLSLLAKKHTDQGRGRAP